jgi:hypothetical protein
MFTIRFMGVMSLAAGVLVGTFALADPPKKDEAKAIPWTRKATKDLPANRIGGSFTDKAAGGTDASLFFIAPKSTGLTTAELPEVYWYISQPAKQVVFTLVSNERKKTEMRLVLKDVQAGFHRISLEDQAKGHDFKRLVSNEWTPAEDAAAPELKALYRMAIKCEEPKLLATAYIARVKSPPGAAAGNYVLQIRNELWYDAVDSLAKDLGAEAKSLAPRKQFTELLQAEEVLRSQVAETANEDQKKKARVEEERVFSKLSVPDPIDLKSDKWEFKFGAQAVPDPIDVK